MCELFEEFETVHLVDPDVRSEFIDAVVAVSKNPPSMTVFDQARSRVLREMTWESEFEQLLALYERVVECR